MTEKKWSDAKGKQKSTLSSTDVNEIESRELQLFIENDADLYRQRLQPIQKNLARKKYNGIYNHEKAVKLYMYGVNDGAKKYSKEYGGSFNPSVKKHVAEQMTNHFETEFDLGNFDEYKQKKFQKKDK
jgi:hypothetical protein